jgi:cathepsin D
MLPLPLSAAILLCLSAQALAAPQTTGQVARQTMLLKRRTPPSRTIEEWGIWAKEHREGLLAKYGDKTTQKKRSTSGTNL